MLSKMDMEGILGMKEHGNDSSHLIKGKRTKRRLRQLSPCTVATTTLTSSCSSATGGGGSFSSTTFDDTEQEEEADMANCLILLAQGRTGGEGGGENQYRRAQDHHYENKQQQQVDGYNKIATTEKVTKNGYESYECKTCNRFFHSFQALGGHRASHKKPKMKEEKQSSLPQPRQIATTTGEFEEENNQIHTKNITTINPIVPPVSLELRCGVNINFKPNKLNKIHECSICGAEFTSGQALGGHMRRHRASIDKSNNKNNNVVAFEGVHVKSRNVLELDLNFPAPEEDLSDSTFQFPAMVGCHY
jgi:DNA-directed RNA polymerase subunit RPC12/RpoP